MGATDIAVLHFILVFGLPCLALILLFLIFGQKVICLRTRMASSFLLRLEQVYDEVSEAELRILLKELHSMRSQDWYLRNRGLLRILVINPKTGEIFKYFPQNAQIIIVDRNSFICEFLQGEIGRRRLDHLQVEQIHVGHAEYMSQVPSGCVDAVVATRVLCSSRNVSRVLLEIQRVLAQGGKYFFVEHTHERHPYSKLGIIQTIITTLKLWPIFTQNCHLNRIPEAAIRQTPQLERLHLKYVQLKVEESEVGAWISRLFRLKPLYIFGHCTKSSKTNATDTVGMVVTRLPNFVI